MLPEKNSLKNDRDFKRVKENGEMVSSNSFSLAFLKKEDDSPSRFGFVISTKISTLASDRNRIKRAMRESVRHVLYFTKSGYDCVFLAKPESMKASTEKLMVEVRETLKKANLL